MKKKIATAAVLAGLGIGTVFGAPAEARENQAGCNGFAGLSNAHAAMIEAQGLERHLDLQVHQTMMRLLAGCS